MCEARAATSGGLAIRRTGLGCVIATMWLLLAVLPAVAATPRTTGPGHPYAPSLHGSIVSHALSAYEPDGDPVISIIISTTLHDVQTKSDVVLILSTYLENFQQNTTPILPDLLNKNQVAVALAGFMQGKAAVVNRAGRIIFRGGLLAETFLDNQVHLIADLHGEGAAAATPTIRLFGSFAIDPNTRTALSGWLRASRELTPSEIALLRAPGHAAISWRDVISHLAVRLPSMMGAPAPFQTPMSTNSQASRTVPVITPSGGSAAQPGTATATAGSTRAAAAGSIAAVPTLQLSAHNNTAPLQAIGQLAAKAPAAQQTTVLVVGIAAFFVVLLVASVFLWQARVSRARRSQDER